MQEKRTILYIEDNFENRILIQRVLNAEGYRVLEAENARKAFEVLKTSSPDLILMDINMPDMDGSTLTKQIKTIPAFANVPVIAVTANVMKGDRERTLEAGCDGYLQKPIDIDELPAQIAHFLELSQSAASNSNPVEDME